MASSADNANRKAGSDESQMAWNESKAAEQRDKTSFRAQSVSASADKFNPNRIPSYPKPIDN